MTVQKKLRLLQQRSGLTQEDLADRLGVTFAAFNRWMNGKAFPRANAITQIEELYQTYAGRKPIPPRLRMPRILMKDTAFGPPYAVLNLSRLGYRYFRIHFTLSQKGKDRLLPYLIRHPHVGWVFEARGFFNLGVGFWARSTEEIDEISASVRRKLGTGDSVAHQSEVTHLIGFGDRTEKKTPRFSIVDAADNSEKLTMREWELTKLLAVDSGMDIPTYAQLLHCSVSQTRALQVRLQQKGVLCGYQQRLQYRQKYFKVFLDSSGHSETDMQQWAQRLWNDPGCLYFNHADDKYDVEFEILGASWKKIEQHHLRKFPVWQKAEMVKNVYTNLFPINKTANFNEFFTEIKARTKMHYRYCNPKMLYLDHHGAKAYLRMYQYQQYAEMMKKHEMPILQKAARTLQAIHPGKKARVIDLGSGNGQKGRYFLHQLGERAVSRYYPVDIQPIELSKAVACHEGGSYAVIPVLLGFHQLGIRFPLRLMPQEVQYFLFLGGTYGNFPSTTINRYLRPLLRSSSSTLLITSNLRQESVPALLAAYNNRYQEELCFRPLAHLGFRRKDFLVSKSTRKILHLHFEDQCVRSFFTLQRSITVGGKQFAAASVFDMSSSWKPTLEEFTKAVGKQLPLQKVLTTKSYAAAICSRRMVY